MLDDIRLNQPVIHVVRTKDGWNIAQLIKARTPDPDEPKSRRTLEIGEIGVSDGTLYFEGDVVGTTGVDVPSRIDQSTRRSASRATRTSSPSTWRTCR